MRPSASCRIESITRHLSGSNAPNAGSSAPKASLSGRTALVTGSTSGIGLAIAESLAQAGCNIVVNGFGDANEIAELTRGLTSYGVRAEHIAADATRPQEVVAMVQEAEKRFGGVDILVNNAGVNVPGRAMDRITVDDWHALVDTNLNGAFHLVHAVLPHMRAREDGLIINVSSIAGRRALTLSGAAYCAAKRGVNALGEMINLEEHEHGIRCTNICPGEVVTEILDKRDAPPSEAQRARMLQPEDVAAAALMCACLPPRAHVTELTITGKTTLPESL